MDTYDLMLLGAGLAMLGAAVVPRLLDDRPLSFPVVYVVLGAAVFALPLGLTPPNPVEHPLITERLSEFVVIVSLMGVGLQIDRAVGWKAWANTWRLLAIAMPLSIAGAALIGWWAGLVPASALLLGAVLAPTDPVLANDVQADAPGEGGEDTVRFSLTSEAGLNDALAFPFTNAAIIAVTATSAGEWLDDWAIIDVAYKLVSGIGIGILGGYLLSLFVFHWPE